jgi:hypothetical protein
MHVAMQLVDPEVVVYLFDSLYSHREGPRYYLRVVERFIFYPESVNFSHNHLNINQHLVFHHFHSRLALITSITFIAPLPFPFTLTLSTIYIPHTYIQLHTIHVHPNCIELIPICPFHQHSTVST